MPPVEINIEERADNVTKSIDKRPWPWFILIMSIAIVVLWRDNLQLRKENKVLLDEYVGSLKHINTGLDSVTDTTKKVK